MTISTITYNGNTGFFGAPTSAFNSSVYTSIDLKQKTIFLIHGFQSNPNRAFGNLSKSLEQIYSYPDPSNPQNTITPNIINVDWSGVAGTKNEDYLGTKNNTVPSVSDALAHGIRSLQINPAKTEIIGHSLGAHIAGFAGGQVKKNDEK